MAKNSKAKKVVDETLGVIDSAIAILNKMPDLSSGKINLSDEVNPISFIMEILYRTVGYDKVIEFVANILTVAIDGIELAVKGFLLSQLKDLFTCTINPFISYDLIKNGVVFSLKNIDIINMLYYSPLDKTISKKKRTGKYYYFGCEEFQFPDELEASKDINALLWYMKNRTIDSRTVWYGYKKQASSINKPSLNEKQKKGDGIITLEYASKSGSLKDAEGQTMWVQTPYDNCIHVFLGNTKPLSVDNVDYLNARANSINEQQTKFSELKEKATNVKEKLVQQLEETEYSMQPDDVMQRKMAEMYVGYMDKIIESIDNNIPLCNSANQMLAFGIIKYDSVNSIYTMEVIPSGDILTIDVDTWNNTNGSLTSQKCAIYDEIEAYQSGNAYRNVKLNYYYHKTLLQFNADYILSLKLFDSKTLAARLLDVLSGCMTIGADISIEERLIQNEVDKMVHDIVESDDTVVNDCFFSFSNEDYNNLIERSELQRLGIYVSPDGAIGGQIDAESVMALINSLSPDATQEEIKSAIEGSLFELTKSITPEYSGEVEYGLNGNLKANLIDNLLQALANVIVMSALTPKIYLLMAINLKVLGQEANFDLMTFIDSFRSMIVGIIRTIRDNILNLFKDWIMEITGELAEKIGAQLTLEQFGYYTRLLKQCIDCFKFKRNLIGWDMADVGADIYDLVDNNEEENEEC